MVPSGYFSQTLNFSCSLPLVDDANVEKIPNDDNASNDEKDETDVSDIDAVKLLTKLENVLMINDSLKMELIKKNQVNRVLLEFRGLFYKT